MAIQKNHNLQKRTAGKYFTLIFIISIASLLLISCSKEEEPVKKEMVRPAKIMTIEQVAAVQTFKFPGKVQALDRVELSFEVSGKLIELAVNEGQHVKEGDLIARIDPSDYESKLDASQASVNQTKAELDRYTNLLAEKVVARSTFDVIKRNYEVAISNLNISRKAYNDTILKASFSGVVGKKFVENYQVIQAKESIVSLQKTSAIEIVVNAPENVMRKRDPELLQEMSAEFANYPKERLPLTIKEISTEADPQTQTYRVIFSMSTPENKTILDGMTATVFLKWTTGDDHAVEVPVQSIFFDDKGLAYVWMAGKDFRVTRHQVQVGTFTKGDIKILSGLNSGDRIITAGVQNLTEGMKVREFSGTVGE
ncbi:MAG: efflux RND transporter periplasmic adaptor subunit [Proteobacteria bacterium]|nr:efflux RND transporter periplasmic adaptor subunit [Pseudomonadota bacterium]MBU1419080.1 efflux RND transporter periplasmic adaptor subunit [Pseudomonadota bacterium]MBU1453941.1 efflux RND transporter periplasmic adaptor subunit [Pseudomonadota bacterium]